MKPVTIIIPWYKKPEQLQKCKKAIKEQTYKDTKEVIWDNNEDNIGFTKAVNNCLKMVEGTETEYAIILNQDCYLKENAVEEMVKFMDSNPRCAIGGIKQISDNDDDMIIHGGCTQAFPNGMHLVGSVENKDCSEDKQMPWINGACMVVRLSAIKEIGLMDENFFLICSDSDWCYTARARGWEVWYISNAECIHEQGISNKPTPQFESIMKKDMIFFKSKWCDGDMFRELDLEIF